MNCNTTHYRANSSSVPGDPTTNNNNSVDYRSDDTTDVYGTADYLEILANNTVSCEGIIGTTADVDGWRFQSTGGAVSLTISPVNPGPNLDILAELYTSTNTLVVSNNPTTTLGATLSATLAAGDYILKISGTGKGNPLTDGYSDYGSLGAYLISGSVNNGVRPDRFALAENSPGGTIAGTVTKRLAHGANGLTHSIASGNTGGAFTINATTGQLTVANASVLNYETLSTQWDDPAAFELFVNVTDTVDPLLNETIRVVIAVTPVNEPPAISGGTLTMFTRTMSGTPVFKVTGSDPDRFDFPLYSITAGNAAGGFAVDANSGQITTTAQFAGLAAGAPMVLTIRATDRGSPALTSDANVNITLLNAPAGYVPGGLTKTYFENINGEDVANLTGNARFPGSPDSEVMEQVFDSANHGNNYGSTARGYLLPPVTGTYIFWLASDDDSELRLSPTALPSGAVSRASAGGATGRYEYTRFASQKSVPLSLNAGQAYYFEARHKEGGGDDHLVVAWEGPGFSRRVIPGIHMAPYFQNYAPRIAAQTLYARRGSEAGTILGKVAVTEINTMDVPGSWTITGGSASAWCAIDANTGMLYVTNAAALNAASGTTQILNVRVSDHAPVPLTGEGMVTISLIDAALVRVNGIVQQIWTGMSGGNVSTLTSDARYPNAPTTSRELSDFDTGGDYGDNYGSRIRAFVTAPSAGSYTFYIASDDESQLRITTGTNYAAAAQVASVATYTARDTWTAFPSQKSASYNLTAGQKIYLEVRHKEGGGGDFVQVAWTTPGNTSPSVIPQSALSPFDFNVAPGWGSTTYAYAVKKSAAAGSIVGTPTATDADGSQLAYSITSGNTANALAINPFTGTITVANPAALTAGQQLTLTLRVQDNGAGGNYPSKTATATANISVQPDFMLVRPALTSVTLPAGQGLELQALSSSRPGAVPAWSLVSGPGTATFDNAAAYTTGVRFSAPGLYQIRGTETAGGVPLSAEFTVQSGSSTALPAGSRIGTQTSTPSHTWNNGTWQILAGGTGLPAGPADSFYFLSQPAGTTAMITARITGVQNLNGHNSLAGVMIREGHTAEAKSVFCGFTSLNGRRVLTRSTAGLAGLLTTSENPAASTPFAPGWVRISRNGNTFQAWTAPDVSGSPGAFVAAGPAQTLSFPNTCLIGLAASSGVSGSRGTAVVDNLTISPSLANLAPSITVSAPAEIPLPMGSVLSGSITDDGRPAIPAAVTASWTKFNGPGTVSFGTPAAATTTANFDLPGTYRLRLTADDGDVRTFREISMNVILAPIESWRAERFGADASNALIAGDLADPDVDGLVNLLEYALNLDPKTAGRLDPVPVVVGIEGSEYLRLSVTRNPQATDIGLSVEWSAAPQVPDSWTPTGVITEINSATVLQARTSQPLTASPKQFLRVRVSRIP